MKRPTRKVVCVEEKGQCRKNLVTIVGMSNVRNMERVTQPEATRCPGICSYTFTLRSWSNILRFTSRNSKEDEIASILEECLSVFRSGMLQDIKVDDLVFCEPSKEGEPQIPPPLQSLATANTQFLQYQDWIQKLSLDAKKLDCEGFERCRSIKCQFLEDLQSEWTKLDELKRRAWQLTSQSTGLTMPPRPSADPALVRVQRLEIDTCEYQNNLASCV